MSDRCSTCGGSAELIALEPDLDLCLGCLLAGRFPAGRRRPGAEELLSRTEALRALAETSLESAALLLSRRQRDEARARLLGDARRALAAKRPLLAEVLLRRALEIPGESAGVYLGLAEAARAMGQISEAQGHYKTAGWLAQKAENPVLLKAARAGLAELAPTDPFLERLGAAPAPAPVPDARCGFCGKPAPASELIQGPVGALCRACLEQLSKKVLPL